MNCSCREKCLHTPGRPPLTIVHEIDFALTLLPGHQRKACVRRALPALRPRAGQWTRSRTGENASLAWKSRGTGGCRPGRGEVLSIILTIISKYIERPLFLLFCLLFIMCSINACVYVRACVCAACSECKALWRCPPPCLVQQQRQLMLSSSVPNCAYLISMSSRMFLPIKILVSAVIANHSSVQDSAH